jgi:hypothetical protein
MTTPAPDLASLLNVAGNIQAAVVAHLRAGGFDAFAESTDDFHTPGIGVRWEAGDTPRRYLPVTSGALAGKLIEDHRPGELTLEIRTRRTDDNHQQYVATVLARMQDQQADLPSLLPWYSVVESRLLAAPVVANDDKETVTEVSWQLDVFVLPGAMPEW